MSYKFGRRVKHALESHEYQKAYWYTKYRAERIGAVQQLQTSRAKVYCLDMHESLIEYAALVSGNVSGPFVIAYDEQKPTAKELEQPDTAAAARARHKTAHNYERVFFARAAARLYSIGWYSRKVIYHGVHLLYVTRVADHTRIAAAHVAAAAAGILELEHSGTYDAIGLGYSGAPWYGRIPYGTATVLFDRNGNTVSELDWYAAHTALEPTRAATASSKQSRVPIALEYSRAARTALAAGYSEQAREYYIAARLAGYHPATRAAADYESSEQRKARCKAEQQSRATAAAAAARYSEQRAAEQAEQPARAAASRAARIKLMKQAAANKINRN